MSINSLSVSVAFLIPCNLTKPTISTETRQLRVRVTKQIAIPPLIRPLAFYPTRYQRILSPFALPRNYILETNMHAQSTDYPNLSILSNPHRNENKPCNRCYLRIKHETLTIRRIFLQVIDFQSSKP